MSLEKLYKGSKIIETIQNYSLSQSSEINENTRNSTPLYFYTEESFWKNITNNPTRFWGKEIELINFVVSDWVARVPGLYWSNVSERVREHKKSDIIFQSQEWTIFTPPGKSKKVLGGIGTLLLPPTDEGKVLMSVSSSCNSSTGIPILVNPEVLEELDLKQGQLVHINKAKWQPMEIQWSKHFDSIKGIPRGYLIIDNVDKIKVYDENFPVVYHPFSIMEYEYKDTILYDFVYVTADSHVQNVDSEIERFFKKYAKEEGRNGEFLLNPNIVNPIFESRYMSPLDLQKPTEKANLKLLYERIRETFFNDIAIEQLINNLPKFYQSSNSIITLARAVGINPAILTEESAVSMSAQLITLCIEKDLTESLIDRMVIDYPKIFN